MTKESALIVGVGMVKFVKPSQSESYDVMGAQAATAALEDAGVPYMTGCVGNVAANCASWMPDSAHTVAATAAAYTTEYL